MSKYEDQNNLGEQFIKAVTDGISSGDFRDLKSLVRDSVSDAIAEAGRQVKNAADTASKSDSSNYEKIYQNTREYQARQRQRNTQYSQSTSSNNTATRPKTTLPAVKTKNVGQVSSILYTVFGGIGTGISSSVLLGGGLCAALGYFWPVPTFAFLGITLGASFLLLQKGLIGRNRLARMQRYISLCAGKMYMNVADLAKHSNKSPKYVLKDLKKMLKLGFFPEGHLDEAGTCLMLDDATYREYLKVEKERKAQEAEQKAAGSTPKSETAPSVNKELEAMMREGQDYIQKIHELNDLIPGEVISNRMDLMEGLLKEIFERLKEDPTQMTKLHKLMNYYLPTTIKLLQAYSEFDDVSSPGTDILDAKAEIEKTVDTINEAFAELLNKLFQATVFDVTTDAQVLKTMLAKEGLTKNDFSEDKK